MKRYFLIRVIRFFLSLAFFVLYTLMFLRIVSLSFLAKLQIIPAIVLLKNGVFLSIFIILFNLILVMIFGRLYCGFFCPSGFLQDLFTIGKRNFSFRKSNFLLPAIVVFIFIASLFFFPFIIGFFDPYSLYGKLLVGILKPAFYSLNNWLHFFIPSIGYLRSYTFSFWLLVYVFSFLFIFLLIRGRFFCNFICPVGAILKFFSKMSVLRLYIDKTKCIKCMKCERVCPAQCIDSRQFYLDYSRCFLCMKCFECPKDALKYGMPVDNQISRSGFFYHTKNILFSVFAFSVLRNKFFPLFLNTPSRLLPSPPGSISFEHLKRNCISCLLCVSHCPSKVLKPALSEYGIEGIFMPVMDYPKSFCIYECNTCGEVCPTGAIKSFTKEEKKNIQIGRVKLIKEKCIVYRDRTDCGACSEVCPTKAVFMVNYEGGLFAPETDTNYCVGCGACENVCPAKPDKAIYVEGHTAHQKALLREKGQKADKEGLEEFPF
ncbi:MAG: 4Fe-4S binding protein [Brevinematia bacterium]